MTINANMGKQNYSRLVLLSYFPSNNLPNVQHDLQRWSLI